MKANKNHIHLPILILCCALLAGCAAPSPTPTSAPTAAPAAIPETIEVTAATQQPTEQTEPQPTETVPPETETVPQETVQNSFVLTFVGDCTFGTHQPLYGSKNSFVDLVQDSAYPFANVVSIFREDDFTMANLEGVLKDEGYSGKQGFAFRGPVWYTDILTDNSVEAVTVANNHTMDYGEEGYASTIHALEDAGVPFVENCATLLFTTEGGLTIGLYAVNLSMGVTMADKILPPEEMEETIRQMREDGAELIVLAVHWGAECTYRPTPEQVELGHKFIDRGVDIVYGSHPHVLQKIEEYNDGVIYYSLGNFSFGGHPWPDDIDTAIIQQEVYRDETGSVHLGTRNLIPASCSSTGTNANNYQPTPYEPDTPEYDRVIAKLDGSFAGG